MTIFCTKIEFHARIRQEELVRNAGALTRYDSSLTDLTLWFVGGHLVGVSGGTIGASVWYKLA